MRATSQALHTYIDLVRPNIHNCKQEQVQTLQPGERDTKLTIPQQLRPDLAGGPLHFIATARHSPYLFCCNRLLLLLGVQQLSLQEANHLDQLHGKQVRQ